MVTAFLSSFFERYVQYNFTADLENKLDDVSGGRPTWTESCWRDFWSAFKAGGRRDQGPAHRPGHRRPGRRPGHRTSSRRPGAAGLRPARLPAAAGRAPGPAARQERRLHRLLQLSGLPLHPAAGGARDGRTASSRGLPGPRGSSARTRRPGSRSRCARAPSASTCSSARPPRKRREKPKRVLAAQGPEPRLEVDLETALALLALPREVGPRHPETRRGRSPPASAATAPTSSGKSTTSPCARRATTC